MVRQVPLLGHPSQLSAVTALMAEGLGKAAIMARTGLDRDRVGALMSSARRAEANKASGPGWTYGRVASAIRIHRAAMAVIAEHFGVSVDELTAVVTHEIAAEPPQAPSVAPHKAPEGGAAGSERVEPLTSSGPTGAAEAPAVVPLATNNSEIAEPAMDGDSGVASAPPAIAVPAAFEPNAETHERASTNDEPSGVSAHALASPTALGPAEAGPQSQAPQGQGTGAGMLVDRDARQNGEGTSVALPATTSAPAGEPVAPPDITAEREALAQAFPEAQRFTLRSPDGQVLHTHKHVLTRLPSFFWVGTSEQIAKLKRQHPEWAHLTPKAWK